MKYVFTEEYINAILYLHRLEKGFERCFFIAKLNALAVFTKDVTLNRGKTDGVSTDQLLAAGYTKENLVDILVVIGDKIISNFLFGVTTIPIDFPMAAPLKETV